MTVDPNSINPDDVRKLVAQAIDFRPDGGLTIARLEISPDPEISRREVKAIEQACPGATSTIARPR